MLKDRTIILSCLVCGVLFACHDGGGGSGVDPAKQLSAVTADEAKRICKALAARTIPTEACKTQAVIGSTSRDECSSKQSQCGADSGVMPIETPSCDGNAIAAGFAECEDITVGDYETCFGKEVAAAARSLTCENVGQAVEPPACVQTYSEACSPGAGTGGSGGYGGSSGIGGQGGSSGIGGQGGSSGFGGQGGVGGSSMECGEPTPVPEDCWACSAQTDANLTAMCDQACRDLIACAAGASCMDAACLMTCCPESYYAGSAGLLAVYGETNSGPLAVCFQNNCVAQQPDCCTATNACGYAQNGICDCEGEFATSWDAVDCEIAPDCCTAFNDCLYAENGICDCEGTFAASWDAVDCEIAPDCCTTANSCDWANDQICDCNGEFEWDSADCAGQ